MIDKPNTSDEELREKLRALFNEWETPWSRMKDQTRPLSHQIDDIHEVMLEEAMQLIVTDRERAVRETEKAYGGCIKCYGKGYATFKSDITGYGTDGDIGGFEGRLSIKMPIRMKFCECDRGKQLAALTNKESNNG